MRSRRAWTAGAPARAERAGRLCAQLDGFDLHRRGATAPSTRWKLRVRTRESQRVACELVSGREGRVEGGCHASHELCRTVGFVQHAEVRATEALVDLRLAVARGSDH